MIPEVPSDLLQALKGAVDEDIEEYSITTETNGKGQGFVGEIVFITLTHHKTAEIKQVIAKQEQQGNGKILEHFRQLFDMEIKFYDTVWPFLKKNYKNVSGKELNFIANCLGTSYTGRKQILLENINPYGFHLYDATKPFDDEHFKIIFKTYGIFHALSMALKEQDREQYNLLVNPQFNPFITAPYDGDCYFSKDFVKKIQEMKEFFDPIQEQDILAKLSFCEETGVSRLRDVVHQDFPNGALIHGDCWSNNLMFKYDKQGKVEEIKLLDFQLVCHGSPIFDLSYCLYSGASKETLNKLDDYLRIYHTSLTETLKDYGLEGETIYPFKTLKEDWKKLCIYGVPLGINLWKVKLIDKNHIPDFSKDKTDFPVHISEQFKEVYKTRMRELFYHLHNNDFI